MNKLLTQFFTLFLIFLELGSNFVNLNLEKQKSSKHTAQKTTLAYKF